MFEGLSVMLGSIGHEIGACVDSALGMGEHGICSSDEYEYPDDNPIGELDRTMYMIQQINGLLYKDPRCIAGDCARVIDRCRQRSITLDENNSSYISSVVKIREDIVKEAAYINRQLIFLEEKGYSHPIDLENISIISREIEKYIKEHEKGCSINYEEISKNCDKDIQLVLKVRDLLNEYADKCKQEKKVEADISEKKEQHYLNMIKAISEHEDFGKRNPVDIGIDLGFEEKDVMEMIEMVKKVNEK